MHGLWHRYKNVSEQCKYMNYSEMFGDLYRRKKHLLETADAFCSFASIGGSSAVFCSLFNGRKVKLEYLVTKASSKVPQTERDLKAMSGAVQQWGQAFEQQNVAFVTSSDEIVALMEFGSRLRPYDGSAEDRLRVGVEPELKEMALDIQNKLEGYKVLWDIFCVPKPSAQLAKLAAAVDEENQSTTKALEEFTQQFFEQVTPVKVKVRRDRD